APSLPAAGSAVEEVEAVAWQDADNPMYTTAERRVMLDWVNNDYPITPLMTVAQHNRIVAALSAQQSAPERVSVPRELVQRAARHLNDWLELDQCECEGPHYCGRTQVAATNRQLRALLNGGEA
ncbi:hypothetical protein ACNFCJ_24090, partial [Pseudomonas sp. NY15364]|uniref:hypothetical protein n=1 Tax=Pseudomonas sp. NY15364 TaxID=3400353 RepID=UPI003A8A1E0C